MNLCWLHLHFYIGTPLKSEFPTSTVTLRGQTHIGHCERGGVGWGGRWRGGGGVWVEGLGGRGGVVRLLWKEARASMHTQTSCDSASPGLLWLKPDLFFFSPSPSTSMPSLRRAPPLSQGPITCDTRDWPGASAAFPRSAHLLGSSRPGDTSVRGTLGSFSCGSCRWCSRSCRRTGSCADLGGEETAWFIHTCRGGGLWGKGRWGGGAKRQQYFESGAAERREKSSEGEDEEAEI